MVLTNRCPKCKEIFSDYSRFEFEGQSYCGPECEHKAREVAHWRDTSSKQSNDIEISLLDQSSATTSFSSVKSGAVKLTLWMNENDRSFRYSGWNLDVIGGNDLAFCELIQAMYPKLIPDEARNSYWASIPQLPISFKAQHEAWALMFGIGVKQNLDAAFSTIERSHESWPMKHSMRTMIGISSDRITLAEAARELKARSDRLAYQYLGNFYYQGTLSTPKDERVAINYFKKAADLGDSGSAINMANRYSTGRGVNQNQSKAFGLYQRAAELGFPEAMGQLGLCFRKGEGTIQSDEKAASWFYRGAERGDPMAQHMFATCCGNGRGLPQTSDEIALAWFRKAAAQQYDPAVNFLKKNGLC